MKKIQVIFSPYFSVLIFLFLLLVIAHQAYAECVQENCANGYGVFIYEDGRIYEGQWKKGTFNGMGALTFQNGTKYTGDFKKGFMHGYGRITLLDGEQHKCTFNNGLIENNDSLQLLWETETKSPVEKHIFYCNMGDAYKRFGNYEKSIEYYNKSLKVNPDFTEAKNSRANAKKQLAKQEPTQFSAKGTSNKNRPKQIILRGTPGVEPGTHSREWIEQEKIRSEYVGAKKEAFERKQEQNRILREIERQEYEEKQRLESLASGGKVTIGMTEEQVKRAMGKPDDINRDVGSWGVKEQWVFRGRDIGDTEYVYLKNGVVTSWSD